jgi:hypothetical protein
MDTVSFNYAAIALATIVSFLLGGLWYSPMLFAKSWLREAKVSEQQAQSANMKKVFGLSFLCTLVMAFNLAAFLGAKASVAFGAAAGAATGIGWVAMSLGVVYLFEGRSLKLWLINSGYQVVSYTVMGAILGAWH